MIHRPQRIIKWIVLVLLFSSLNANAKSDTDEIEAHFARACRQSIIQTEKRRGQHLQRIERQDWLPFPLRNLGVKTVNRLMVKRLRAQIQDYLRFSGTEYHSVECDLWDGSVEEGYWITPKEDGSWLNRSASILNLFRVNLILQPGILKYGHYGQYNIKNHEIVLALPPWLDTVFESLTHETYHALLVPYGRIHQIHFLGGMSLALDDLARDYPRPDWSEIGAYLQTLISCIEMHCAAEPGTKLKQAQFYPSVIQLVKTLVQMPNNFRSFLERTRTSPPSNLEIVEIKDRQVLSLRLVNQRETDLMVFAFVHKNSLQLQGVPSRSLAGGSTVWSYHDLNDHDQELILERLDLLISLFDQFRDEAEGLLAAYEPEASADVWARKMLTLRPLLHELNRRWLNELVPENDSAYFQDEAMDFVFEAQRACQRLLR